MLLKWFQKNFKQFCLLLSGKQFRRFVFFGLICNILGVTSLYLFTEYFKIHYLLSLIISLIYVNFINKFYLYNLLLFIIYFYLSIFCYLFIKLFNLYILAFENYTITILIENLLKVIIKIFFKTSIILSM